MQNGFFARFCIDRMGIAVQSLRDNPPGAEQIGPHARLATHVVHMAAQHDGCYVRSRQMALQRSCLDVSKRRVCIASHDCPQRKCPGAQHVRL